MALSPERRERELEDLRMHARALAVELKDVKEPADSILSCRVPHPRSKLLRAISRQKATRYRQIEGWNLGTQVTSAIISLTLGKDGQLYVSKQERLVGRRGYLLSDQELATLQDVHALRRCLHYLEERSDVFNKLKARAE